MTLDEFLEFLRKRVAEADSQAEFARQLGINQKMLNEVLTGVCAPQSQLLAALGFTSFTLYVPLEKTENLKRRPRH